MRIAFLIGKDTNIAAIIPSFVKKNADLGLDVVLSKKYNSNFLDDSYSAVGAKIETDPKADVYICPKPDFSKLAHLKKGDVLIASIQRENCDEQLKCLSARGVTCCVLEKIPRITKAQSMDILSSQANLAGYRAVIEALQYYRRVMPMMVTAAGTVRPAKVLVLGAGVSGLQAIATAKRMGAIVHAFDVRAAAKEQVESLGASFINVENDDDGEISSGYAKEMTDSYKKRQEEKLLKETAQSDIIITTAQIPGKPAPRLISEEMLDNMPVGSVVVDMAVGSGGNCALSKKDEVVHHKNVTIIGSTNLAEKVSIDASQLLSCNIYNFVKLLVRKGQIDTSDEIVQNTLFREV